MKTNNYTGLVFSVGVIALAIGISYNVATHKVINVDNEYWYTTVADTRESMALGLGDRDSICSTCGMLFDFKDGLDKERIFWMKDMKFNLDIYWLDKDYNILLKEKNLSPDTYFKNDKPLVYGQGVNARYVFEVKAR